MTAARIRDVYLPGDRPPPRRRRRRAPGRSGAGHPDQSPRCACQWGPTGHCSQGNHTACSPHTVVVPDTHLTYADGTCVMDAGEPVAVWRTGQPCQWTCSCTCHTSPAPALALAGGWEQPALPL